MNLHCPTCTRPLPDAPAPAHLGAIRFCCDPCVTEWIVTHDRRQRTVRVQNDRRAS